jgi:hypothetical protein
MSGSTSGGSGKLRIALLALGFGLVVAAILGGAAFGYGKVQEIRSARLAKQARADSAPSASAGRPVPIAMVVAPAPLPSALPVIVREGKDAYGPGQPSSMRQPG